MKKSVCASSGNARTKSNELGGRCHSVLSVPHAGTLKAESFMLYLFDLGALL